MLYLKDARNIQYCNFLLTRLSFPESERQPIYSDRPRDLASTTPLIKRVHIKLKRVILSWFHQTNSDPIHSLELCKEENICPNVTKFGKWSNYPWFLRVRSDRGPQNRNQVKKNDFEGDSERTFNTTAVHAPGRFLMWLLGALQKLHTNNRDAVDISLIFEVFKHCYSSHCPWYERTWLW